MGLFKKKNTTITVVHHDVIHFLKPHVLDCEDSHLSLPFDSFIQGKPEKDDFLNKILDDGPLMVIVPDYWIGNTFYRLRARQRHIIEAFIIRKLQSAYPDLEQVDNFFEYFQTESMNSESGFYVCFAEEPKFYQLNSGLDTLGFKKIFTTTPAYLWQAKLKESVPDFTDRGKTLIHLEPKECFLYFYSQGRFLFSRDISFPQSQWESEERFETLAFELNQSFYLFSQKARTEIDSLYLFSPDEGDSAILSESLGREITPLKYGAEPEKEATKNRFEENELGSAWPFIREAHHLVQIMGLRNRMVLKDNELRPIRRMGMVIGLLLCCLLLSEAFFLWDKSREQGYFGSQGRGSANASETQYLHEYEACIDTIIKEKQRVNPEEVIFQMARAMPENGRIVELLVHVNPSPQVTFNGIIKADDVGQFKERLLQFLAKINANIPGAPQIGIQDVNFEVLEVQGVKNPDSGYRVSFGFSLS